MKILKILVYFFVCKFIFEFLLNKVINIDNLVLIDLSEKLSAVQIEKYFEFQGKWFWLTNLFVIILFVIKSVSISMSIYAAIYFFNKNKITFKNILNIVLKAEFIFLLVPLLKILWFSFFQTNYTLEDIQYFYPLSALNIIGFTGLEPWLVYPLQILNLFELAYIIYLAYEIGKLTQTNADKGFKIMVYSYVPTMLLWVCVVMFLTLSMS